jgi:hypothetical protein
MNGGDAKRVCVELYGYYAAVSMTLNVAHVMPPEGTLLPLK